MPVFKALLKSYRIRAGYGLRQFAEMIGEAPSNYAGVESGARNPWRSSEKLRAVADALTLEEGTRDWDAFFFAAGKIVPPDVERIMDRPMIPVLLRTVDELQLSEDQLRKLCATLRKRHGKGRP